MARLAVAALIGLLISPSAAAAADPPDQPPFGGEPLPEAVPVPASQRPPAGFELSAEQAIAIADRTEEVREERAGEERSDAGLLAPSVVARDDRTWEVTFADSSGVPRALVVIDDRTGEVVEAWTDHQVETKLARGYEDAVAGDVNEAWIWIPLCVVFVLPFFDPRRPFRLLHLDLLALLAFGASHFFFNRGEIETSVPLVYPVLGYLFVRMLVAGFRPRRRRERLVPLLSARWLVVGIVVLVAARIVIEVAEAKVIDVGLAGAIGADRLVDGHELYGEGASEGQPIRGDVYGPVNYLAYVPFEQALPWSGEWDEVPSVRAATLAFDLLTALALFALGRRLRRGEGGEPLGLALAFAWLAYPYTFYVLGSSFNDSLVPLLIVASLLVFSSPPARGALVALAGLTKFGPLALAPLFAGGTGERRLRSAAIFTAAFAAVAVAVTVPVLPDGGPRELYDRSFGYQASRGSPFSLWGLDPSLEWLQTASKAFAIGLALVLFFVPRRRDLGQICALSGAVIIAVQVSATHWFYPFTVWFAPLVLAAAFASHRLDSPGEDGVPPRQAPRTEKTTL
jgi:hypothetical protein